MRWIVTPPCEDFVSTTFRCLQEREPQRLGPHHICIFCTVYVVVRSFVLFMGKFHTVTYWYSCSKCVYVPIISKVRPLVIARISHLEFFNGSVVTYRERQDAERAYLRAIAREHPDPSSTPSSAVHPRYAELMEKYGQDLLPASGVFSKVGSTLSSELVSVTLCNLTFSSGGSLQPVAKKLPATLTVLKLKMIVKQIFGLDPALQQLSIRVSALCVYVFVLPII